MVSWSSIRRNRRHLAALSRRDLGLLVRASVWLAVVALGRRLVSFRRLQALLGHAFPLRRADEADLSAAPHLARLVDIAARHGLVRATCLDRSLVLWGLLRRRGIDSALQIGARKAGEQFEAHAWLEYQGAVLNDAADVRERFVTLTPDVEQAGGLTP